MDSKDRRILLLLRANARLTYQELGQGVGLSTAAAFQRVRKLEDSGVIAGYHARVAPEAAGTSVVAVMRLDPAPDAEPSRLLAAWEAGHAVEACYRTVGGAILVKISLAALGDLEAYVEAARAAGCAVHAELVSSTIFER